ncbi:MAG: MFS transporter [Gaiellales bacterium]
MGNALLASADGRRFLVAQLMDSIGAGLSGVVLPWLVLDAGGSRATAGAAFLVSTVPYLLVGLPAGNAGDRWSRRRVMVCGSLASLAGALVIPLTVAGGVAASELPVPLIFAAGLMVTAGRVFVDAAAFGAVSRLVGDAHFVEGQSALSFVWSLGLLVGPAVGGVLIGLLGADDALWVQAAGFTVAAVLLRSIRVELGPDAPGGGRVRALDGLRMVTTDPVLRMLTALGMAWNLSVNMFYALIVVFARQQLGTSGPAAGRMLAVGGAAGLVGGLTAPVLRRRLGPSLALRASVAANAAAGVAMALAPSLLSATAAFAGLEATALLFITLVISERQARAAPHAQGRVGITGRMAALLAASGGAVVASVLVARLEPSQVFAVGAVATASVALAAQWLLRSNGRVSLEH